MPLYNKNYESSIPDAYKRYTQMLYAGQSPQQYVQSQTRNAVRSVGDATAGYYRQMGTQGATGILARGGGGTGAQDYLKSNLFRQRAADLSQAGSAANTAANNNVFAGNQNLLGMAQGEGFRLTSDELNRFFANLDESKFNWQKKQADKDRWMQILSDLLGAGGQAIGAYAGAGGG